MMATAKNNVSVRSLYFLCTSTSQSTRMHRIRELMLGCVSMYFGFGRDLPSSTWRWEQMSGRYSATIWGSSASSGATSMSTSSPGWDADVLAEPVSRQIVPTCAGFDGSEEPLG